MRRIQRRPPSSAVWKRWLSDCSKAAKVLTQQVARGEKPAIGDLYKRKSIKDEYFLAAGLPFYGKCAYCEAPIRDYQHGDRLAYEWTNLLPTCVKCNQDDVRHGRRIGKHSRFPVESRHAQQPEEVAQEKPLLINPLSDQEADAPSRHLLVDTKTGVMAYRTPRGQACIAIFGLNLRDQLVDDRRRACLAAEALWARLRHDPSKSAEILEEIAAIRRGEKPFTTAQAASLRELAEQDGIVRGSDT